MVSGGARGFARPLHGSVTSRSSRGPGRRMAARLARGFDGRMIARLVGSLDGGVAARLAGGLHGRVTARFARRFGRRPRARLRARRARRRRPSRLGRLRARGRARTLAPLRARTGGGARARARARAGTRLLAARLLALGPGSGRGGPRGGGGARRWGGGRGSRSPSGLSALLGGGFDARQSPGGDAAVVGIGGRVPGPTDGGSRSHQVLYARPALFQSATDIPAIQLGMGLLGRERLGSATATALFVLVRNFGTRRGNRSSLVSLARLLSFLLLDLLQTIPITAAARSVDRVDGDLPRSTKCLQAPMTEYQVEGCHR